MHHYFHFRFLFPVLSVPNVIVEFLFETTGDGALCLGLFGFCVEDRLILLVFEST